MVCTKCNKEQPLKLFAKDAKSKSGKSSWCKKCKAEYQKIYARERRKEPEWRNRHNLIAQSTRVAWYGLSDNDYDEILALQGGVCAGCGMPPKPNRRLDIDHQHQPNDKKLQPWERASHVRGLLCHLCNRALGVLRDRAETLEKLAKYLREPPARTVLIPKWERIVHYFEEYELKKELYNSPKKYKSK